MGAQPKFTNGIQSVELRHQADEHLHINIKCSNRTEVDLDIHNTGGRRLLSIRANGMGVGSHLIDIEPLLAYHSSDRLKRFCPFCGEKINLASSRRHKCKEQE